MKRQSHPGITFAIVGLEISGALILSTYMIKVSSNFLSFVEFSKIHIDIIFAKLQRKW